MPIYLWLKNHNADEVQKWGKEKKDAASKLVKQYEGKNGKKRVGQDIQGEQAGKNSLAY